LSYNSVWKEADTRTNFPELQQNFEPAISSSLPLSSDFLRVRTQLKYSRDTVTTASSVRAFPHPPALVKILNLPPGKFMRTGFNLPPFQCAARLMGRLSRG